jgi:hypothetical protein
VGLVSLAMGNAAAQELIVNGSFEQITTSAAVFQNPNTALSNGTLDAGEWAVFSSLPGWTAVTGTRGIEVRNAVAGSAYHEKNFVELDSHPGPNSNSGMEQSFDLIAASPLKLSFFYAARPNTTNTTNAIKVFWNGLHLSSILPNDPALGTASTTWTEYTAHINGKLGTNTLGFTAIGTDDTFGGSLDKVSVTVVPEPEAYGLALAGMGVVAFAMRRRKTKAS